LVQPVKTDHIHASHTFTIAKLRWAFHEHC